MVPHFWNCDKAVIRGKGFRYRLGGGQRNYRKKGASWNRISTDLNADRTLTSFPAEVEFGKSAQDWNEVLLNSSFSMKRYHDHREQENPEPPLAMRFRVRAQSNVAGAIEDGFQSQVRYRNAWDGADLRVGIWHGTGARFEKVVEIHSEPAGQGEFVEYEFEIQLKRASLSRRGQAFMRKRASENQTLLDGSVFVSSDDSELRGFVVKPPVCWWYRDGELVRHPVKVRIRALGNGETILATKLIPRRLIRQALRDGSFLRTDATFQPDADPEVNSMDFWTQRSVANQTWASLSTGAGNGASASQTQGYIRMRSTTTSGRYDLLNRCNQFFDTSSLTGIPDSGTMKVRMSSKTDPSSHFTSDLGLFGSTSTSVTAPVVGDFQLAQTTQLATSIAYGSVSTSVYNTFTLNASGLAAIDTSGLSKFVTALSTYDLGGSTPTWASNINHNYRQWFAEQGTSYAPELEVTTVAPTNTPAALLL